MLKANTRVLKMSTFSFINTTSKRLEHFERINIPIFNCYPQFCSVPKSTDIRMDIHLVLFSTERN